MLCSQAITDLEIVADAYAQLDALRAWALEVGKVTVQNP